METMDSFAAQLHDSLFDENGLVTALGEIQSLLSLEYEDHPSQERVIEAGVSIEGVTSDDEDGEKGSQDIDYEEVESVAFGVREKGAVDVDEVSRTTTQSGNSVKIQRTNVEMLLGDDRKTSLLQINSLHSYGTAIRNKIGLGQKNGNEAAQNSRFVDIDDISDTSRSEAELLGTQRTNVEMLLDDGGKTSLLQLNSRHIDSTDMENRNAVRGKLIKSTAERSGLVETSDENREVPYAMAAGNLLSGESFDFEQALSHLPRTPSVEDFERVSGSIKKTLLRFTGEDDTGNMFRVRSHTPIGESSTNYFPDILKDTLDSASEKISKSFDGITSGVSNDDSEEFIKQMEGNIKESMREFNAYREIMIDANERDAPPTTRASVKVERRDESAVEPEHLTSELVKDVMAEEVAVCTGEISKKVSACDPRVKRRVTFPQRSNSERLSGPVDIDSVSLSTTKSERALKRREKEQRQVLPQIREKEQRQVLPQIREKEQWQVLPQIPERKRESSGPVDVDAVSLTTTRSERALREHTLRRREREHRQRYKSILRNGGSFKVICS